MIDYHYITEDDEDIPLRWTESEKSVFNEALGRLGKDFKAIAEVIVSKNQFQCKNYYYAYRRKLNLDDIVEHSLAKNDQK